ncbi:hypothetical protein C9374_010754 [Naegleria lovaniensis]|uniref:Uncharacterized protein n=1 Tax=Naegleria lovaniensis TaxID=51637 RepID=A0AA88GFD6_NAELO|nr:uncharacterized protein C9374_010754 [Naegleria lovaniensis]KAG2374470.1 hypothetical protein C9374_010754 [Naegleria lovaniensis]
MSQEQQPLSATYNKSDAPYYNKEVPYVINSEEGAFEENPEPEFHDPVADKRSMLMFAIGFLVPILHVVGLIMYGRSKSKKAKKFAVLSGYMMIFTFTFWVLLIQWVIIPVVAMTRKN